MGFQHWFYTLPLRLRSLFRARQVEQELDEELQYHLERQIEENVARGMTPTEARYAALRAMNGIEQQKERCRDMRRINFIEHFFQDIRYGLRMMRKNLGFTIVAVTALALGIGANSAIFSIVYGLLLRPLPYPEADRIAMVYAHFSPQDVERGTMSIADYLDWKAQNQAFEDPVLISNDAWRFDLIGVGQPVQVAGTAVTANFFTTLQAEPLLGRVLKAGEDTAASEPLVIISESLWKRHFGANPNVIGQSIKLGERASTIIGVMPASFRFWPNTDVWLNLRLKPPTRRGPFPFIGLGKLKPGVTLKEAQTEMNAIGQRIEAANPKNYSRLTFPVVSLQETVVGKVRPALLIIFGAVLLVLMIAVVNVANLLLARAGARGRELAIRTTLGASRGRLIKQMLTESILLSLSGGLIGLAIAYGGILLLRSWNPGNLPRVEEIHLNGYVLAFTFLVSLITGTLFGLFPALHSSSSDLTASLKDGGRGSTAGRASQRTRALLVISEIALSLVLLIGAGLMLRSFILLQQVNAGFQTPAENLLTMQISVTNQTSNLARPDNKDGREGIAFYQRLEEQLQQLPGVESTAISDSLPPDRRWDYDTFQIEGQTWSQQAFPAVSDPTVSAGYFRTLGVPLIKGRFFEARDNLDGLPVCIISESLAKRYFANQDAIGKHLKQSGIDNNGGSWLEIVGVVGDLKYRGLDNDAEPSYYLPAGQGYSNRMYLVVRTGIPAIKMAALVRSEIEKFDNSLVITNLATMADNTTNSVAQPRFRTYLLGLFALLALLLAVIGIYGIIAYSVSQRTNEIGIRIAMGATRIDILRLILGQGLRLIIAGTVIGIVASMMLTRLLSGLLFGVTPTDSLTFIAVTALLCTIALAACYIPAHRAMQIDPMAALRHE